MFVRCLMLQGPDAFYEAQGVVYKTLEEQHYPSFIISDVYQQYIKQNIAAAASGTSASGSAAGGTS